MTVPPTASTKPARPDRLFGPNVPEVGADTLQATGFTFQVTVNLRSVYPRGTRTENRGPRHPP